jgi:hypothetical protein
VTIPERTDQLASRRRGHRRMPLRLRPQDLHTPQRRRTLLQPLQTVGAAPPPDTTRKPSTTVRGSPWPASSSGSRHDPRHALELHGIGPSYGDH